MVTTQEIVSILEARRDQIDRALEALMSIENGDKNDFFVTPATAPDEERVRRRILPQTRKRMSDAMKKRWREARKAGKTRIGEGR